MIPHDYFVKVKNHFNGNDDKAWEWFKSVHSRLGLLSPLNLIKLGRKQRVMNYIDENLK